MISEDNKDSPTHFCRVNETDTRRGKLGRIKTHNLTTASSLEAETNMSVSVSVEQQDSHAALAIGVHTAIKPCRICVGDIEHEGWIGQG